MFVADSELRIAYKNLKPDEQEQGGDSCKPTEKVMSFVMQPSCKQGKNENCNVAQSVTPARDIKFHVFEKML